MNDYKPNSGVRQHYGLPLSFYRLWLGETLAYSCARYRDDQDSLDEAQRQKLDKIDEWADPSGSNKVLDIGCGWGSLIRHRQLAGKANSWGLTLSEPQANEASKFVEQTDRIVVKDWRAFEPNIKFDSIVAVGSIEHFAATGTGRHEKLRQYQQFVEWCAAVLVEDGTLVIQCIVSGDSRLGPQSKRDVLFILREIFPGSRIPSVHELTSAVSGRFDIEQVENDGTSYALTTRAWHHNLSSRADEARLLVGDETLQQYLRYLSATTRLFQEGCMDLVRMQCTLRRS